ncbi:uncharacterized protein LOC143860793 [Tasmannia lanceolata]|uniref:uncharacterized protein LOC143860793 n=1 Tax=Tasmannia lanceolata TaxID=3420 RepID=UPI004063C3F7
MMRYQRVSPDCLPLSNGRKPNLRTCKEDDVESGRIANYNSFEGKTLRFRSGTTLSTSQDQNFPQFVVPDSLHPENNHLTKNQNHESSSGGDVLLQWGQNKRSRGSRAENRVVSDESTVQARQVIKIHKRVVSGVEKQMTNHTTTMPPPLATAPYSRGANLRPCLPIREPTGKSMLNRNLLEERSDPRNGSPSSNGSGRIPSRSADKRSPQSPDKTSLSVTASTEKPNGVLVESEAMNVEPTPQLEPEATTEKLNLDLFEWPRIYISLSRKEKEDDFFAMKGTKLPQRPKKRAKNVDKTLQYCFPGMWLSDLTRGRYEVREKKCVKKKRRGLKGMESLDSDSE